MFFLFQDSDFDRELAEFVVDPKLQLDCDRAGEQIKAFRSVFPLERLYEMSLLDYRDPQNRRNDFCSWITKKTNSIVGAVTKSKAIIDAERFYKNLSEWQPNDRYFHEHILSPLCRFVHSRGSEIDTVFESYFGVELLRKLLVLYYPESFINISHSSWIDQIVSAFNLMCPQNIYLRNREISEFYRNRVARDRRDLSDVAFVAFLNDYLGLGNRHDDFLEYLTKIEGVSEKSSVQLTRALRQLSRLLVGFGVCKKSQLRESSFWSHLGDERTGIRDVLDSFHGIPKRKKSEYNCAYHYYCKSLVPQQSFIVSRTPFAIAQRSRKGFEAHDKKADDFRGRLSNATTAEEVVRELCESARRRPFARHYTTFSAFLSITENTDQWMFRLTRGDDPNMNDQLEWQRLGDMSYWKRTFISSFSCVQDESAAMWGLYGKPNNEAIRLSFTNEAISEWLAFFHDPNPRPVVEFAGKDSAESERMSVEWSELELFWGDVLYGGNVRVSGAKSTGYVLHRRPLPKAAFSTLSPPVDKAAEMTGFIKSIDWEYEDECRLLARIKPTVSFPNGKVLADVKYVYLPIPPSVLKKVSYMVGPCVPDKLGPIVRTRIEDTVADVMIEDSKYKGNLKFK